MIRLLEKVRSALNPEIHMDQVLWEFAKQYRKRLIADQPGIEVSDYVIATAALYAFHHCGHASREVRANGQIVWIATPKFLNETGLARGEVVTVSSRD
jgi:hypothetical protein